MENIDEILLVLVRLMPSIGKCETVYASHMMSMVYDTYIPEEEPIIEPEKDERMQLILKYQDFDIDIRISSDNYICYLNDYAHPIKKSTYDILDNYCKKHEYGKLNHEILAKRLGISFREKKLERINK